MIVVCKKCDTQSSWVPTGRRKTLGYYRCTDCGKQGRLRPKLGPAARKPDPDRPVFPLGWPREKRCDVLTLIIDDPASRPGKRHWASQERDRLEELGS